MSSSFLSTLSPRNKNPSSTRRNTQSLPSDRNTRTANVISESADLNISPYKLSPSKIASHNAFNRIMIWIPHPTEAWIAAEVISQNSFSYEIIVSCKNPENGKFENISIVGPIAKYDLISDESLHLIQSKSHIYRCDNFISLKEYSQGIILHYLKLRYYYDTIYTFIGNILLSMNPNKPLDIYNINTIELIRETVKSDMNINYHPHVFTIAEMALQNMFKTRKVSILISGESGSGKTETSKALIQYITNTRSNPSTSTSIPEISVSSQSKLMRYSMLILESFGHAKTLRNHNASRFSNSIDIYFDIYGNITSSYINLYYLETSRLIKFSSYERNFHIFYMLLASNDVRYKTLLHLNSLSYENSNYLNQSSTNSIDISHRNEYQEYHKLIEMMNECQFTKKQQDEIFQCLVAIIHLGNLRFQKKIGAYGEETEVISDTSNQSNTSSNNPSNRRTTLTSMTLKGVSSIGCNEIAKLLDIELSSNRLSSLTSLQSSISHINDLEKALCNRENIIKGEIYYLALKHQQASYQRDLLAMFLFETVFEYVIRHLNTILTFKGDDILPSTYCLRILQVFGFESMKENSLDQLCINYCNERLHNHLNEIIFINEFSIYKNDGIDYQDISFEVRYVY